MHIDINKILKILFTNILILNTTYTLYMKSNHTVYFSYFKQHLKFNQ